MKSNDSAEQTVLKTGLEGYVRVPMMALQAGAPLPLSIFLYVPMQRQIVCYRRKSELLDLESFMELIALTQNPTSVVLALKTEYDDVMTAMTLEEGVTEASTQAA